MENLRNRSLSELEELVLSMGQPKFRAKQLFGWIYKGKTSFREMHNLPEVFVKKLEESCTIDALELVTVKESSLDGTRKFLFRLADGNAVESVFMRYKYGNSVCISSQAGCRMGCAFCASGLDGLVRNLTAGEMISQVLDIERETGEPVNHIVVMGTGEPFDNYHELSRFIRIMNDKNGANLGMRSFTVSTCGLVPKIARFAEDFPQVNLAISLHAATEEGRSAIMPVNRSYPLSVLIPAVKEYTNKTNRRVTFEFALIHGVNDRDEDVEALYKLVKGMLCHVNLIPLNEVSETGFVTAGRARAREICEELDRRGVPATVRRQMGADIDGACGQLRLENSKKTVE